MDEKLYRRAVFLSLLEVTDEATAKQIVDDCCCDDDDCGFMDIPEDDDGDLQGEIMNFVINNPYPTVDMMKGLADTLGIKFEDLLRQLLIQYTQLVISLDGELEMNSLDDEWHPAGFDPETASMGKEPSERELQKYRMPEEK